MYVVIGLHRGYGPYWKFENLCTKKDSFYIDCKTEKQGNSQYETASTTTSIMVMTNSAWAVKLYTPTLLVDLDIGILMYKVKALIIRLLILFSCMPKKVNHFLN